MFFSQPRKRVPNAEGERIHYFAYGSNMHPLRLWQRVPSCEAIEVAEVAGFTLRFHKRSLDGSGKCNLYHTGRCNDRVLGVVYRIEAHEKPWLDEAEGIGRGYDVGNVQVTGTCRDYTAFTYLANPDFIDDALTPYSWYRALVTTGARFHQLPSDYVDLIEQHQVIEDPDESRHQQHLKILEVYHSIERTRAERH